MRGLMIKDLRLMANQKTFFLIMLMMGTLFQVTQSNPYMAVGYLTVMGGMFTITTFSYDEIDNGAAYLFTLPFERRDYVGGKYAFGFLTSLAALAASVLMSAAVWGIKTRLLSLPFDLDWKVMGFMSLVLVTVCVVFLAVAIPVELKFGVEKGRIGFVLILAVFFLGYFLIMKVVDKFSGKNPFDMIDRFQQLPAAALAGLLCLLWVVFIGISMLASMRIIRGKEY